MKLLAIFFAPFSRKVRTTLPRSGSVIVIWYFSKVFTRVLLLLAFPGRTSLPGSGSSLS